MFISLNKKIIYSIIWFFLFISLLLIYSFYNIYSARLEEEQRSILFRNQQYMSLLNNNINLKKEIKSLIEKNPTLITNAEIKKYLQENNENFIIQEQKHIEKIVQNYDERYNGLKESLKITLFSSINIFFLIIVLGLLIRRWVVSPIENLSAISTSIAKGSFSQRVKLNRSKYFPDEIDTLAQTYNQMLDTLEKYIQETKDSERFLQSLIDSIPDGIRVIDENYNIIIANKEYYKQSGCQPSCLGKCFQSAQQRENPCPTNSFVCPVKEICHNKLPKLHVIQQFSASPERHLSINAAPLIVNGKKDILTVEVIRDLSDNINFSHQQKMSSLAFLTSSIAHEIKNSLGSVRMITEKIIEKYFQDLPENDEKKQLMNMVYKQIIQCIDIPERLLSLTRINSEKNISINCGNGISDVVNLLDYEAKHNGININTQYLPDLFIKGNETDFKMIIINLMLNAIKASANRPNAEININASKENKEIVITVTDNGHGIPAQRLSRIFEPFYSEGKQNENPGSGLGLSIVKSIISRLKGKIDVQSRYLKGTTFTLRFPSARAPRKK